MNELNKFKKFTVYIILIIIIVITITNFKLNSNAQKLAVNNKLNFEINERDPSSWKIQIAENEKTLQQKSIFPSVLFSRYNENAYPFVSAIINRIDDSDEGIKYAVNHLLKYPFVKEIIIYNQVRHRPIKLKPVKDVYVEVVESDNTSNLGKFTACAMARYGKCYFQDDLWLNTYLDSLYTHSYRYSDHLIANTRNSNYMDYLKWRFQNSDISLHTGFADLKYGALVPQFKVQNFLSQLSLNINEFNELKLKFIDIYFSIWLNQYPYLIFNPLLSYNREKFKHIDTVNNRLITEHFMYDALHILESNLKNGSISEYVDKSDLSPSVMDRDVRSTCSNDKCLFITNIDDMPNILDFNTEFTPNISEFNSIYNERFTSTIPDQSLFMHHSYHKAVDQNTETCWKPTKKPREGDYFGLYMMGDIIAGRVILYTPTLSDSKLDEVFKVYIQFVAFGSWEECQIKLSPFNQLNYRVSFGFECPNRDLLEPFKSIRVQFAQNLNESFELCGLGLDNFVI